MYWIGMGVAIALLILMTFCSFRFVNEPWPTKWEVLTWVGCATGFNIMVVFRPPSWG